MARFDWPAFLQQNSIEFVTSGPNTARDHISIKCVFCGSDDPSQHLGISLRGKGWGCLRNSAHRGKSPAYLVQRLLGCSMEEARRITGSEETAAPTRDEFAASFAALQESAGIKTEAPRTKLTLLKEFKPLLNGSPFATHFMAYLMERGYRGPQIRWLAENYKLHYVTQGLYRQRIIVPVFDRYGAVLTWTARTILPDTQPRYRTLRMEPHPDFPNEPLALLPANNTVLGLPVLWGAENPRVLVVVEGPFDALKVTAFGHALGVYATCLFGLNVYPSQVEELAGLMRRFERCYLLVDEDAELQRLRLLGSLRGVHCQVLRMPPGSDDPGALPGAEVVRLALGLTTSN